MRKAIVLLFTLLILSCAPSPSTSKLQAIFSSERSTFETIAEMLREDTNCDNENRWDPSEPRLISISENEICGYVLRQGKWYPSSPGIWMGPYIEEDAIGLSKDEMLKLVGISEDRLNSYLTLMNKINIKRASLARIRSLPLDVEPEVSLLSYGFGFMHKGYSIYYVERDVPPNDEYIVEDIMGNDRLRERYVPLSGNWYLERLDL